MTNTLFYGKIILNMGVNVMKKVDEIQEFLKYFSDEEIINYLTSPEQKIELYEFVIATLCLSLIHI